LLEYRQRYADDMADRVFPGFGRIEQKDGKNGWRIDYLNTRNCHMKHLGLCFSMKLP
jgi:hypothetical protein